MLSSDLARRAALPVANAEAPRPGPRLRCLPARAKTAAFVLLACAVAPPSAILGAATWGAPTWVRPGIVNLLAGVAAFATLIVFDPPRSASPLAYARQLRARFLELQTTYDADSRRRSEGKEKEDDHEVLPDP